MINLGRRELNLQISGRCHASFKFVNNCKFFKCVNIL
jgi:hypothetical protein